MIVSALSIVAITLIVSLEVFLRAFAGISTLISAEFAGYLLAANVFLGMAWTFRNGGFIRVDIVHSLLQGRLAALVNLVIVLIATITFVTFTWYLYGFVWQSYCGGATSIFIYRTPLWIPQLVMPVGGSLMCWALFAHLIRNLAELIRPGSTSLDPDRTAAEVSVL